MVRGLAGNHAGDLRPMRRGRNGCFGSLSLCFFFGFQRALVRRCLFLFLLTPPPEKTRRFFYTELGVALSGGCEKEPLIELLDLCKVSL